MVHPPLFEWVVENLCKNAVDAIGGSGTIAVKILRGSDSKVFIDISDTGKGIPRSKISMVFRPGFTTKKRGWGLGLTLAKRIIESYHNGKIFVKSSDENQGTTFRIALNTVS
jgi:signal transduction histidine kinase